MRRNDIAKMHKAELAIHNATAEVEIIGADERLTEIVTLLGDAKKKLSDFLDEGDIVGND